MKKHYWIICEKRTGWGPPLMVGEVLAETKAIALSIAKEAWGGKQYIPYKVSRFDFSPCRDCGEIKQLHPWEACRTFKNLVMHSLKSRPRRLSRVRRGL